MSIPVFSVQLDRAIGRTSVGNERHASCWGRGVRGFGASIPRCPASLFDGYRQIVLLDPLTGDRLEFGPYRSAPIRRRQLLGGWADSSLVGNEWVCRSVEGNHRHAPRGFALRRRFDPGDCGDGRDLAGVTAGKGGCHERPIRVPSHVHPSTVDTQGALKMPYECDEELLI